jgi:hypothetical protein
MTPLSAVICKAGFELTLIRRLGRMAIYRQHLPGGNPAHDAYEVILPQVRNTDYEGQPVEPYEGYPAAESWGKKGWTFTSLAKAVQKLKEVAGNASRVGTVSRKNRVDGPQSSRGAGHAYSYGLTPHACEQQSRPVEGEVGLVSGVSSATQNRGTK